MQTQVLDRPRHHEEPLANGYEIEALVETETRTGEDVRTEFARLWNIYTGRRAGISLTVGNRIIEDDVLATRYFHENDIEETYWRTRTYEFGDHLKGGMQQTEVIFVRISTENYEQEIHVDESSQIHVRVLDRDRDEWIQPDQEGADGILNGFFERAGWAAMMHGDRTAEQQQRADNEAIGLLHERYPVLVGSRATAE